MTTSEIQATFPHRCAGYGCSVCWWVDGRQAALKAKKNALLARLKHVTRWQANQQEASDGGPSR